LCPTKSVADTCGGGRRSSLHHVRHSSSRGTLCSGVSSPSGTNATFWYVLYQKASDYSVLAQAHPIRRRCCVIGGIIGESAYRNCSGVRDHSSKVLQGYDNRSQARIAPETT